MRVLRLRHGGIACALPHARIRRIAAVPDDGQPRATLWAAAVEEPAVRWVEIEGIDGAAWIACSDLRVDDLGEPQPLPALVDGLVGLAHVVGWAVFGEEIVWLVDPARLMNRMEKLASPLSK